MPPRSDNLLAKLLLLVCFEFELVRNFVERLPRLFGDAACREVATVNCELSQVLGGPVHPYRTLT